MKNTKDKYVKGFYCRQESEDYKCDSEEELRNYVEDWEPWNPTIEYWYDEENKVGHITWESCSYTDITKGKEQSLGTKITIKELLDMWWNSVRINCGGHCEAILYKDCKDGSYELDENNNPYGENILNMVVETSDQWRYDSDYYPIIDATFVEE